MWWYLCCRAILNIPPIINIWVQLFI